MSAPLAAQTFVRTRAYSAHPYWMDYASPLVVPLLMLDLRAAVTIALVAPILAGRLAPRLLALKIRTRTIVS
jgi:hypothetical protein